MHLICTKLYNVYKNVKSGNPLAQPTSTLLKHVLLIGGGPCLPGIGSQVSTITVKYFKDTEHVKMEKSQPAVENIRLELAMAPTYSMLPYQSEPPGASSFSCVHRETVASCAGRKSLQKTGLVLFLQSSQ